jgi:menaquinone-dependent protoporphyrinogen oxidase
MSLLVIYASRHGATAEIAARIATRLVESGASVDLRRVDEVETLDCYDAVVLGAPVYDQSWPPEANAFVAKNRDALAVLTLWLFSVGAFGDTVQETAAGSVAGRALRRGSRLAVFFVASSQELGELRVG